MTLEVPSNHSTRSLSRAKPISLESGKIRVLKSGCSALFTSHVLVVIQPQDERLPGAGPFYGGISKSLRMILQSAILAVGAYLVVQQEVATGVMIASSIMMGRALAPVNL